MPGISDRGSACHAAGAIWESGGSPDTVGQSAWDMPGTNRSPKELVRFLLIGVDRHSENDGVHSH